jgi:hypothetical protein
VSNFLTHHPVPIIMMYYLATGPKDHGLKP